MQCSKALLLLEHSMSTTLQAVGSQVWRGSLLMADYLLYQGCDRFRGSVILELGAGTGLVSIIAGLKAGRVFCTGWCCVRWRKHRLIGVVLDGHVLETQVTYILMVYWYSQISVKSCWICVKEILKEISTLVVVTQRAVRTSQ